MPNDLNGWVQLLGSKSLPLLATTRAALQDLMGQSQLSVTQYTGPVLLDPGFAVQLFQKANGDRKASGRIPLTTLSNALSHLGQGRFQQQLEKVRLLDEMALPELNRQGYLRYVAQACHASFQASEWARSRNTHEPEEMQCAALLQNIAELALWCYGDDVMIQIEKICYGKKQDYDAAAQQVLGCDIRKLSAQLATLWHLPELTEAALLSNYTGFTLATGVALSAQLARLTTVSWYDKAAMQCIQAIAQYKGKSPGEVETRLHKNALDLTGTFQMLGYMPPARLLPMLVDEAYVDPQFLQPDLTPARTDKSPQRQEDKLDKPAVATTEKTTVVKPSQKTPDIKPAEDTGKVVSDKYETNPAVARSISDLHKMIQQKATVPQLIQQAVDVLRAAGFQRVVFAVKVSKLKMLVGRFVSCDDRVKDLKDFKIALDRPSLFKLLLEKPNYLWINDNNRAKYWNMVPDQVKLMLSNDSFFVMSVFSGKQAIGLMYVDKITTTLNEDELKKFIGLCRLLMKGIVEVSVKTQADQ